MKSLLLWTVSLAVFAISTPPTKVDANRIEVIKVAQIRELQIPAIESSRIRSIDWSDFDRLVLSVSCGQEDNLSFNIYIVDANGNNLQKLTSSNRKCQYPRWISRNRILYIENEKLSVMDIEGNDLSSTLSEQVRKSCTNPWLLSEKYGLVQHRGDEIVLLSIQGQEQRLHFLDSRNWRLWSKPALVCDKGGFLLGAARPQYRILLQRMDLEDGNIRDLALYADPSTYWGWNFACSGDSTRIVYVAGCDIWAMSSLGCNSHRLYQGTQVSAQYSCLTLSPTGDKMIFLKRDLKGDRKWRLWFVTLEKDVRPLTTFDKLEAIIISDTPASHTIAPDEILALEKKPDERISMRRLYPDSMSLKPLVILLQRSKEKDVIVLDYSEHLWIPVWVKRCFYNDKIEFMPISDEENTFAIHTDNLNRGVKDNCRIYMYNRGEVRQIWHQVLTNIYRTGHMGELTLGDGPGYRDLIATVAVHHFKSGRTSDPITVVDKLNITYKWDGNRYIGDQIEERVSAVIQRLNQD